SFFFFSSRRRHTRSYGDWSSDVCSSDLLPQALLDDVSDELNVKLLEPLDACNEVIDVQVKPNFPRTGHALRQADPPVRQGDHRQIGRASCRERVCMTGGEVF